MEREPLRRLVDLNGDLARAQYRRSYASTFSRTVWRLCGGAEGLVVWYQARKQDLVDVRGARPDLLVEALRRRHTEGHLYTYLSYPQYLLALNAGFEPKQRDRSS